MTMSWQKARDEIRHLHKQWELDDDLRRVDHGRTIVHVWNKSFPAITVIP